MKYLSMLLIMLCSTLPVFAQHAEIRGKVTELAKGSAGADAEGYRKEFIALVLASR